MLVGIILSLFCWSANSNSNSVKINEFAFSKTWLNLYNYKKIQSGYSSRSAEDKFFFHTNGATDPLAELKAAVLAFYDADTLWGHIKKSSQCAFPARFKVIQQNFPEFKYAKTDCPELDDWVKRIDAKKISFVYAGSYPNNPASMFGHSLLRIHKSNGSDLLDYNIAFRAAIAPGDDPLSYTYKGISGSYQGFYEIRPYYENLGQYSNSESRDLWEYPLNLTPEETELFIFHLWEVSQNTGFRYYFLDENCSYFLLTLLQAARPEKDLTSSLDLLVHPIESMKPLFKDFISSDDPIYRPSIGKRIHHKLSKLTKTQLKAYRLAKAGSLTADHQVLDVAIDYWKYKLYKKNGLLLAKERSIMDRTYIKRAGIAKISKPIKLASKTSPHKVHPPSKIELSQSTLADTLIKFDWGYHGINDREQGMTRFSFIDYLGLQFKVSPKLTINKVNVFSIYSLEHFSLFDPKWSWHGSVDAAADCASCSWANSGRIGVGLSNIQSRLAQWLFVLAQAQYSDSKSKIFPFLEYGLKWSFTSLIFTAQLRWTEKADSHFKKSIVNSIYYLNPNLAVTASFIQQKSTKGSLGLKFHY